MPDGTEIENVGQFEQMFGTNLGEKNIYGHTLMRRDCLCQIDIDQAMFRLGYRKDVDYEDDGINILLRSF